MVIIGLLLLGLCLGSFVNALVWRVHEQDKEQGKKRTDTKRLQDLSISKGRSMCPHCSHELSALDLLPVVSWVALQGKCRYCRKSISWQYPLVEIATALLFIASYVFWPTPVTGGTIALFGAWLLMLTGLMALVVYDIRWMLLPNRIVFPLYAVGVVYAGLSILQSADRLQAAAMTILSVAIGGGIFYLIYQISKGNWIGGGDVKLGWLLGLFVGGPQYSFLYIFIASLLGTALALPLMAASKLNASRVVPFGPFLIAGAIITVLFGNDIIGWYMRTFIGV